ncbi:MAG TPA: NAD(P)/FAD-dependent oxidoreductase [Solirubrobacteraceae bacterium]|jgi:phytoene dehydrogenase-like protein|nr:NAD(P)/FAD-dependent oxidoreductase [Solirubrobacteraceae bacterium]
MRLSRDKRVIVVGAGSTGLVAAIHLGRAGLDVTVLEHAPRPGGASASGEVTLPGFIHDHCAGFNPMGVASPALTELELESEGVSWISPESVMSHPFDDGTAIELTRELGPTVASLEAVAPGAGRAWGELIDQYRPLAQRLVETVLGPLPPVGGPLALAASLRRDGLLLARRMTGSVEAFGLDVFDGARRPTAWLAGSAQHSGLPPATAGSGAFGFLLQLLGHSHSWPFPEGGQGRIVDALVSIAMRDGVRVRCDATVEGILTGNGRVTGVRLRGGEELAARDVVTTISAKPLAAMLPDDAFPHRLIRRLRIWRYSTAAFKLDYALSAPVPWTAAAPRRSAVVHVAGELESLAAAAQAAARGEVPERPALVVGQHTLIDRTRAPDSHHTLYCYAHVPARYDCPDDEVAGRIEAQLERFAPGFAGTVLARSIRNPRQTESENPSLVGGDLAGGSYELDQQLVFRPAPELCRYRTPLPGLYVSGASVHPGGAVHGMGGRSAARALLADRRLRPWRA